MACPVSESGDRSFGVYDKEDGERKFICRVGKSFGECRRKKGKIELSVEPQKSRTTSPEVEDVQCGRVEETIDLSSELGKRLLGGRRKKENVDCFYESEMRVVEKRDLWTDLERESKLVSSVPISIQ